MFMYVQLYSITLMVKNFALYQLQVVRVFTNHVYPFNMAPVFAHDLMAA